MAEYVDLVVQRIVIPEGNPNAGAFSLEDFETEMNMNVTKEKTPVHTLNRLRKARGFVRGPLEITGAATLMIPVGSLAIDFYALFENDVSFLIHSARKGGTRIVWSGVEIAGVDESANADGTVEWALDLVALDFTNKN